MNEQGMEPTLADQIGEHLNGRLEELFPNVTGWGVLKCARHLKAEGRPIRTADIKQLRHEVEEVMRSRAGEKLMGLDVTITYYLTLSWGGPADYFELDWSPASREWLGGHYVLETWFEGARLHITNGRAQQLAELFNIQPAIE